LPPEVSELFEKANIRLDTNQLGNMGYFNAESLADLQDQVNEIIAEYFSRELTEEKLVIRYIIQTTCAYCLDIDGKVVPNGSPEWVKSNEYMWINGTIDQHASQTHPFGINVYAKPQRKEVYKYKSGMVKTEYHNVDTYNDLKKQKDIKSVKTKDRPYLKFLDDFVAMRKPNGEELKEIDYTEDSAKFFVDMLVSICHINEKIKDMLEPDKIQHIIDSKQRLLS